MKKKTRRQDNVGSHSEDELENFHSGHTWDDCVMPEDNDNNLAAAVIKTEADGPVDLDPALGPKTYRPSRKLSRNAAAPKQDVAAVNIAENDMDQGDTDGLEHQPVPTRCNTERTVNRTKSPATDDAVHPRATRKGVSKGTAGASKATAVRKGTRTRAVIVESSDEDSEHVAPAGEGRSVTRSQPVSDNSKEVEWALVFLCFLPLRSILFVCLRLKLQSLVRLWLWEVPMLKSLQFRRLVGDGHQRSNSRMFLQWRHQLQPEAHDDESMPMTPLVTEVFFLPQNQRRGEARRQRRWRQWMRMGRLKWTRRYLNRKKSCLHPVKARGVRVASLGPLPLPPRTG